MCLELFLALWSKGPHARKALLISRRPLFKHKGVCDEWYVDDGQALVRPALFDSWLRALDMALLSFGAIRGTVAQGNTNSSASLFGPRWVQVLHSDDDTSALGAQFDSFEHICAQVWQAVTSSSELRQAILSVDHVPTEVVLTSQCADVSRLT